MKTSKCQEIVQKDDTHGAEARGKSRSSQSPRVKSLVACNRHLGDLILTCLQTPDRVLFMEFPAGVLRRSFVADIQRQTQNVKSSNKLTPACSSYLKRVRASIVDLLPGGQPTPQTFNPTCTHRGQLLKIVCGEPQISVRCQNTEHLQREA